MRYLAIMMVLVCGLATSVLANPDQVSIEKNLSQIGQAALDSMFGQGNFILRVKVALSNPQYSVKYTQQSSPKKSKKTKKENSKEVYLLPGYPALKNLAPDSLNQYPFDSVTTMSPSKIRRMQVQVIVNKAFPKSFARKSEPILKQVLGLKDGRDTIKYEYKKFYFNPMSATQNITIIPGPEKLLSIQNILSFLMLLAVIGFVVMYVNLEKKKAEAETGGGDSGPGVSVNVNPNLELPKGMGGGQGGGGNMKLSSGPQIKRYFDFVSDDNVENFIILLKEEKLPIDVLSSIISFLNPDLATQVMKAYGPKEQAAIAANLIELTLSKRNILDKLEEKFLKSLECFAGGKTVFNQIFDLISSDSKKKMLDQLKKTNPAGFKKVRGEIMLFEDIRTLQDADLKVMLSEANLEVLSTALISVDQAIYSKIDANLTQSARDMVSQYLEIKGSQSNQNDIDNAQDQVIKLTKRLAESGKISLKKGAA